MKPIRKFKRVKPLNIDDFKSGTRTNVYVPLFEYSTGKSLEIPVIVARGSKPGPTLGITAAVHGNELNGIKIIHAIFSELDLTKVSGSIVSVPIVNVPGFNLGQRYFEDGVDLNHTFPGKSDGTPSAQFARSFSSFFLPAIDILIDIHTASEGRLNTMYVRADLSTSSTHELAMNINPQIILDVRGGERTLRGAARKRKIPAITIEAGNPSVIQGRMVFEGELGIRNAMITLGMLEGVININRRPVICPSSKWIRTTGGGLLETKFKLMDRIEKKQLIANTIDPFGAVLQTYSAPTSGIVIGMAANPVAIPGTRFCHLGKLDE